ncbi:MAG: hypothetical protein IT449_00255 [Phycisphaerales bacterium]|nr:hypothetical protein [Phycisphaerales bacterium]
MEHDTGILVNIEEPWSCPLAELELRELRARYADLTDRAAEELMRTGFDLDDVDIVRMLRCRSNAGRETLVEVRWLADAARLHQDIAEALDDAAHGSFVVTALMVSIRRPTA